MSMGVDAHDSLIFSKYFQVIFYVLKEYLLFYLDLVQDDDG